MNMNEYQLAALRTANGSSELDGVLGLNGEAGEIADMYKKHMFQGHKLNKADVAKELGDCLWYIAMMSDAIGYDLESIASMNIEKLNKRYPEGFDVNRSVNRSE